MKAFNFGCGFRELEFMRAEQGMAAGTAESLHFDPQVGGRERQTENGPSLLEPQSPSTVTYLLQ